MLTTRFTQLVGCSVPIQQAGMGGLANPSLAAAVTNAGGLGIMATDAIERASLKMAALQAETAEYLRAKLPPSASVFNPIDVLGDALPDRYALGLEAALKDPGVDGVLCLLSPQLMTRPVETAS